MQVATKVAADELLKRRGPKCLWPADYSEDSLESCLKFVLVQTTWDEPAKSYRVMPDRKYIREYVTRWYLNRQRKGTLVTEKCRRMVVSWLSRACELWDMGLGRSDGLLIGEDLEASAKQIWRYQCLYDQLKKKFPGWKLPEYKTWKHQGERQLRAFQLANGSRVSYANGEAESVQGDGLAWVVCEELSLYPYASGILAQSKIITQGEGGTRGGYIHAICNAKAANQNWQDLKRHYLKTPTTEICKGMTVRESKESGVWFLELDWFADEIRDNEWLKMVRKEMSDTPFEYREQILRQDDVTQGSLFTREMFDNSRRELKDLPQIVTLIVALDPSVSDPEMRKNPNKAPDDCGILVGGICGDAQAWLLKDLTGAYSPDQWSKIACKALQAYAAELKPLRWVLVGEKNQGGELIRTVLNNVWPNAPVELVQATIGKRPRAEPTAQLFEQDRCHIVGQMPELEREAVGWNAYNPSAKSPNRVDAFVWLLHAGRMCGDCEIKTFSRMAS